MGVSEQKARELARAVNLDLRSCNIKKWQSAIDYEVTAKEKNSAELTDSQWVSLAKIAHRRFISQSKYDPSQASPSSSTSSSLSSLSLSSSSSSPLVALIGSASSSSSSSAKKITSKEKGGILKPVSHSSKK